MSDAIERTGPATLAPSTYEQAEQFASVLSRAEGFVPKGYIGKHQAILAAMIMGSEIGIGVMQSLRSIYVVEGKPTLSAELMLALAIRAGVRVQWLTTTRDLAHCKLTRPTFPDHEHRFDAQDAKDAGLWGKNVWKKYPASMLRARCISAALRAWSPDVLGSGVYVEGEIEQPREERYVADPMADHAAVANAHVEAHQRHAAAPAPDVVDAEPEPPEAPTRLDQCETVPQFEAWCRTKGPGVLEMNGDGAVAHILQRGAVLDVPGAVTRGWLGLPDAEAAQ